MRRLLPLLLLLPLHLAPAAQAQEEPTCVTGVPAAAPEVAADHLADFATGEGVSVAIIDTGVNAHPALSPVEPVADLVSPERPDPLFDCDGHGTTVASVIRTIAPDARLLSIRQTSGLDAADLDDTDAGSLASLADAIHLALDHDADLINISVVACVPADTAVRLDSRPLNHALTRAEDDNALVIAAAGNQSPACQDDSVVYPTHFDTVAGVAARATDHDLADYSLPLPANRPVLSASGHVPVAPSPAGDGWVSAVAAPNSDPREFHGTSFAAPAVTGTAALILQRHPHYTTAEMRAHLHASALPAHGLVDPLTAITHVTGTTAPVGKVPLPTPTPLIDDTLPRAHLLLTVLACAAIIGTAVVGLFRAAPTRRHRRARPFLREPVDNSVLHRGG